MKRFLILALVGVLALGLTSTAYATLCANDAVPAATLLFPFVEYDYDAGLAGNNGATTIFAITNVSSNAQIVHITLWTDYSIAILDFNVVLTGYDVQTINIRDILRDGMLPYEGNGANIWEMDNEGGTPADLGPFSSNNQLHGSPVNTWFNNNGLWDPEPTAQTDLSDPLAPEPTEPLDCDPAIHDASPNHYAANLPIDGGTLANFRNFLEASMMADTWYADCAIVVGPPYDATFTIDYNNPDPLLAEGGLVVIPPGDFDPNLPTPWWIDGFMHPAWMYVTVDLVGACNKDLPDGDAAHYFGDSGEGVIYDNVLMGDVMWADPADEAGGVNYSEGDLAVHIEAGDFTFPPSMLDDDGSPTTFYSRYHAGTADAALVQDYREPLGTAWGLRYVHAPNVADASTTSIRAWKGATNQPLVQDLSDGDYSVDPSELYSNACTPYTYYAWDEDENVIGVSGGFIPPWSGEDPQPLPQPNLFPLETQEVDARQFYLVGDPDLAFGWMMFIWPRSNTGAGAEFVSDQYQTWMGVKYRAFNTSSAAFGAVQLANWNCTDPGTGGAVLPFPLRNRISE